MPRASIQPRSRVRPTRDLDCTWHDLGRGICERFLLVAKCASAESRAALITMYERLFDLILSRIAPERAHAAAFAVLDAVTGRPRPRRWLRRITHVDDELIRVDALGLSFPSPLGVAAGLDKDAEHFEGLGALGFGFVEVGTLTPRAQDANPRPILARGSPPSRALLNRMGFPNNCADAAARRLAGRRTIVGANVGKNRDTALDQAAGDYAQAARTVAPHADYLVLNVSSPNTPGLRDLESADRLRPLVEAVQQAVADKPLLVNISPDLSDEDVDAVADMALRARARRDRRDENTTDPPGRPAHAGGRGGRARLGGGRRGVRARR